MDADTLISRIAVNILDPIIGLMFAYAIFMFLYGVLEFIIGASNEDKRIIGKDHMIWGLLGIVIMISVWGIMAMICRTLELGCAV